MQQQKNDKTTCLLLALTTIFWGSLYTASKVLLDVIQPFTLLCLRYIIAAIAMTILQRLRKPDPNGKPRRIKGGDWKYVIMFGLGGMCCPSVCSSTAPSWREHRWHRSSTA